MIVQSSSRGSLPVRKTVDENVIEEIRSPGFQKLEISHQSNYPIYSQQLAKWVAPSYQYFYQKPFFAKFDDKYVYVYRLNLAQTVEIDCDVNGWIYVKIFSHSYLLSEELEDLQVQKQSNEELEFAETEENLLMITSFQVPDDSTPLYPSMIKKFESGSKTGILLEIWVKRIQENYDKSHLVSKRSRNFKTNIQSSYNLKEQAEKFIQEKEQ